MNNIFKKKKGSGGKFLCCLLSMMLVITVVPISQTFPVALSGPEVSDNIHSSEYDYLNGTRPKYSFLHKNENGYERVECCYKMKTYMGDSDGSGYEKCEKLIIEQYDNDFNCQSKKIITLDSDCFGSVLYGKDYNYILSGNIRKDGGNTQECLRMNIYSKDWAKVGSYADQMGTLALPFWGGSCEMVEDEKYIYLYKL